MVFILDPDDEDTPVPEWRGLRIIDTSAHEELEQLTQQFLRNGGTIEEVPATQVIKKGKSRREAIADSYRFREEQRESKRLSHEQRYAKMLIDDIPKVVAIREELARGVRGLQNMADATGMTKRVIERLVKTHNLPVCMYSRQKEEDHDHV